MGPLAASAPVGLITPSNNVGHRVVHSTFLRQRALKQRALVLMRGGLRGQQKFAAYDE